MSSVEKMLPDTSMRYALRGGGGSSGDSSAFEIFATWLKQKERFRFRVQTHLSNSSIFLDLTVPRGPLVEETLDLDEELEVEETSFEAKNILAEHELRLHTSTSRNSSIDQQRYVPSEETSAIPITYVDVIKQTRRSIEECTHTF